MVKLSSLQRIILLALLDPSHLSKTQRQRNAELYQIFFKCDDADGYIGVARASLSRSYRRLEAHGLIKRVRGRWQLTDNSDGFENGMLFAMLELVKLKESQGKEAKFGAGVSTKEGNALDAAQP